MKVGDEVVISGQQSGVIKYLGTTHFQVRDSPPITQTLTRHLQPGVWAGVELHRPVGLHGGEVDNVEYFICKPR